MHNSYLIQRAEVVKTKRSGVDGLIRLDYMGAAEFEFGEIPKALKRVRENIKEYTPDFIDIGDKRFAIFCKISETEEVKKIILKHASGKSFVKEYPYLKEFINNEKRYSKANFWWDIDNDFFWWENNKKWTNDIVYAIRHKED